MDRGSWQAVVHGVTKRCGLPKWRGGKESTRQRRRLKESDMTNTSTFHSNSIFHILRNHQWFSTGATLSYIPPAMHKGSNFSTSSPTLVTLCYCCFCHLLWFLVIAILLGIKYLIIVKKNFFFNKKDGALANFCIRHVQVCRPKMGSFIFLRFIFGCSASSLLHAGVILCGGAWASHRGGLS